MRFFRRGSEPQPPAPDEPAEEPEGLDPGAVDSATLEPGTLEPGTLEPGTLEPGTLEAEALEPERLEAETPDLPAPTSRPDALADHVFPDPLPGPLAATQPEPVVQWAWGADYSPEKADAARRERQHEQLEQGLEKSRTGFGARLLGAFGRGTAVDWDEVEETLITGDVGAVLSMDLVERARKRRDLEAADAVRAELAALLAPREDDWEAPPAADGAPAIVLVVGVNGTGKTTTIGKLAARERANGRRVVLAAADTFRAAAIDQLRIWAQRTGSEIVAHAPNADPAAVVFDALDAAIARHADILIADTAGRLHTKSNLMEELAKVRRMIDKRIPGARVETFFVLDATTGQNGLAQAKAFHQSVGLTGVVLTKLDSTAKGGIVFAIERELGVPVRFVGVGEQADDLLPFDPEAFVAALFE